MPTRSLTTAESPIPVPPLAPAKGLAPGQFTDRLLDIKAVSAKTTISRSKLYEMISAGFFPKPIHLAPQMVRWRESTIDAWMDALEAGAALTFH